MRSAAFFNLILQAVFPDDAACFACNAPAHVNERFLCEACEKKIFSAEGFPSPAYLDGLVAGYFYTEALHSAMHRLKYSGQTYLAALFAPALKLPYAWEHAVLVPVPLHKKKEKERGYNQSELLAKALMKRSPMKLELQKGLLVRMRETEQQAGKNAKERAENMRGAFLAKEEVKGKRIVLVDDVLTTGSTMLACAAALRVAGAKAVYGACACVVEEKDLI